MSSRLVALVLLLSAAAALVLAAQWAFPADLLPRWVWLPLCAALLVLLGVSVRRLQRAITLQHQAEEAYRRLFEDASDAIVVAGPQLQILEVNARACELLGCTREEALAGGARDLILPDERARGAAPRALSHGDTAVRERHLKRNDGKAVIVEVSVRALHDGRIIGIARDVTARREAEEALRASEALTRSVVYSAVDGIITCDEQGIIQSFNPAAERLFGYPAEEAIGQNLSMLMPSPDRERHDGYMRRYRETGERRIVGIGREVLAQRKDGTVFPIELAVSEMVLPGRRMFTGIAHDITARKEAEVALKEANVRLQAVIETSPLAVMTLDFHGNVLGWNPAAERIFGWTAAEVLGRPIPSIPDSERPEFMRSLAQNAHGEAQIAIERRRRRKDGSQVDVMLWTALLRGAAGEPSARLAIVADVTQRKLVEEQFRHAQKMEAMSRLAGGMAHDFNNLLTVISGYGQMAIDRASSDQELQDHIREVLKASEQASGLTQQLLLFGRHSAGTLAPVDLDGVLARLQPELREIVGASVELVIVTKPGLGMARTDTVLMEQVIRNLVVNARDAMPSGGRVTIETANVELGPWYTQTHMEVEEGEYVMLAVSDTGPGIPPEVQARLFEPFFSTKERGLGVGLGLSTVYGIVRQCGGHIWVYSEAGQGTVFKVYLPRAEKHVPRRRPASESRTPRSGAETVLLVEDETGVRALVREILRQNGYRVLEAADVEDALRLCREHEGRIHLLLTDVVMPVMSGRELAEQAAQIRPDLKVLYMSGYTDNIVISHGVDAGDTDFLQKPFTPAVLARKVRDVLDRV